MKKFTLFLVMALVMLTTYSCKQEKPEYDLEVSAEVMDSTSTFNASIQAHVFNVANNYFPTHERVYTVAEAGEDGKKAKVFLNKLLKKYAKRNFSKEAYYTVHVKGYFKYHVTVYMDETYPQ